ncbi:MAG: DUF3108 domain-containing protein [Chlorobi bacterium]|nr:DUF3108 domain-containing protein [Chlorobiota bacterium]
MNKIVILTIIYFFFTGIIIAQPSNCNISNNAFKSGEEIKYIVSYNWGLIWIDAGAAVFKTKDAKINNNNVLHLIGAGTTFSYWDWFFKMRDIYQSWVDPVNLKPLKYNRDIQDGEYYIKVDYDFNRDKNLVYSASERTRKPFKRDTIKITPCTYDVLSIIYYARTIDYLKLKLNDTIPISVIMDNEVFNIYFRYKGVENKKVKDFGTFNCIRFGVFLVESDLFKEGEDMDVWVTNDKNKIPVLIESPILIGSIKARIVEINGAKNTITSLQKTSSFF